MRHVVPPLLRPRAFVARFSANQPPNPPPDQPPNAQSASQQQNANQQQERSNRGIITGIIIAIILLLLLACAVLAPGIIGRGRSTASVTPTPAHTPGLTGAYYQMPQLLPGQPVPALSTGQPVFTTVDFTPNEPNFPAINNSFDVPYGAWGITGKQHYPHPELGSLGPNGFGVRWTGMIQPSQSGTYTFSTISDDGVRVWVNGTLLVDNWTAHAQTGNCGVVAGPGTPAAAPSSQCSSISLTAGQYYSIEVDYYENNVDGATIQLYWQTPQMASKQIVPESALSH